MKLYKSITNPSKTRFIVLRCKVGRACIPFSCDPVVTWGNAEAYYECALLEHDFDLEYQMIQVKNIDGPLKINKSGKTSIKLDITAYPSISLDSMLVEIGDIHIPTEEWVRLRRDIENDVDTCMTEDNIVLAEMVRIFDLLEIIDNMIVDGDN